MEAAGTIPLLVDAAVAVACPALPKPHMLFNMHNQSHLSASSLSGHRETLLNASCQIYIYVK